MNVTLEDMVKLLGVQLTHRTLIVCGFTLLLLALGYRIYKFRKPSDVSQCSDHTIEAILRASTPTPNATTTILHPTEIVVEPWQGRHNIYAIFQVPTGFQPDPSFMVMVDGVPYCGKIEPNSLLTSAEINPTPSSTKPIFAKFRTRSALWLIAQGQGKQLRQPQNWQLVITQRS